MIWFKERLVDGGSKLIGLKNWTFTGIEEGEKKKKKRRKEEKVWAMQTSTFPWMKDYKVGVQSIITD